MRKRNHVRRVPHRGRRTHHHRVRHRRAYRKSAVDLLREQGVKAGLFRPITLYPFPTAALDKLAAKESVKEFITVELSMGQYIEDVKLVVEGRKPVKFFNRTGGNVMTPEDIVGFASKEA